MRKLRRIKKEIENEAIERRKIEENLCEKMNKSFNDGIKINTYALDTMEHFFTKDNDCEILLGKKNSKEISSVTMISAIKKSYNKCYKYIKEAMADTSIYEDFKFDLSDSLSTYWNSLLAVLFTFNDYINEYLKQPDYDKCVYEHYEKLFKMTKCFYSYYSLFMFAGSYHDVFY